MTHKQSQPTASNLKASAWLAWSNVGGFVRSGWVLGAMSVGLVALAHRAATNLQLGEYATCIADCEVVFQRLDPSNSKVYLRAGRAEIQQGRLRHADTVIKKGLELSPSNVALKKERCKIEELMLLETKGDNELEAHHYGAAKATYGRSTICPPVLTGSSTSRSWNGID